MSNDVKGLILDLVPSDGSPIGNPSISAAIRKQIPELSDADYMTARDALVAEGRLAKGRGRGGSVYRIGKAPKLTDESDAPKGTGNVDAGIDHGELDLATDTLKVRPPPTKEVAVKKRKIGEAIQIVSYQHPEKRVNNPEVGMVHPENDPDRAKTKWAFDPHIDPALQFDVRRGQIETLIDDAIISEDADRMRDALRELRRLQAPYLAWAGKAEHTSFEVDTVSLHVHERIIPARILAAVQKRATDENQLGGRAFQPNLFDAPFLNLPLRQALEFYKHEKDWSNRLIAGDSLLVMTSLLQKENMAGRVQMIYMDPPYGIKYGSNFQPFTGQKEVRDGNDQDLTQEPEMIKAFRDTWELGIHSYLTYMRDRLLLAHKLLDKSGSVFVQISDENIHHVRELLDDVFRSKNFVSLIVYSTTGGFSSAALSRTGDYILWYAKEKTSLKYNQLYTPKDIYDAARDDYDQIELHSGARRALTPAEKKDPSELGQIGRLFTDDNPTSQGEGPATVNFDYQGLSFHPGEGNHWKASAPDGIRRVAQAGRYQITPREKIRYIRYLDDFEFKPVTNAWFDVAGAVQDRSDPKIYVVQTSNKIIERCLLMTTEPGDLVLDPTCGSGTTAAVAEKWGRRWITCDTSRVAITLAKQRLMTATYDYYPLRYPHEGLKGGFDYKTVSHVTQESISKNSEIDELYANLHPQIEAALSDLNAALKKEPPTAFLVTRGLRKGQEILFLKEDALLEWEVPFEWPGDWPESASALFKEFRSAHRAMQRAINTSVAEHAESRTLYDQPAKDNKRQRITGPFSVEAVPSPIVSALDQPVTTTDPDTSIARSGETARQTTWRDELMKTGIRGKGGQILGFAELEAIPGMRHLHASGTFSETGERAVVSFGPEHAAFEQRRVEMALLEAETLRPAPKFVIFCSFAFDPEAAKDIDEVQWPGVTLLKAQMNPDLLTEDLKKARASNQSFWLMGQPDVEVRQRADGLWEVEVNGFDYFDTKAGELTSGGKKQIAMWSLDTDYDRRSLYPDQVFFPMAGAKNGWNRLRQEVKAEIDVDLLKQFHGTVSLPFTVGDHRRIAVKIVDNRGIESLKIVSLDE